jgi:plasmid stabilization system protein ParE
MARLIWSPPALRDVQRLYRFLASKNPNAATRAVKAIRVGVKALGQQPGIGRPIDEMPDEFREWLIDFGDSGYVVRYHLQGDAVTLLAVRHQKEVGF